MTISANEPKLKWKSTKWAEISFPGIFVAEFSENEKKIEKKIFFGQVRQHGKPPTKLRFWHYTFFRAIKSCYILLEPPFKDDSNGIWLDFVGL